MRAGEFWREFKTDGKERLMWPSLWLIRNSQKWQPDDVDFSLRSEEEGLQFYEIISNN